MRHNKAFFSTMQNKTDTGTSLVSKSLPIVNLNSVNCLFSARKKKYNVLRCASASGFTAQMTSRPLPSLSRSLNPRSLLKSSHWAMRAPGCWLTLTQVVHPSVHIRAYGTVSGQSHGHQSLCETTPPELSYDQCYRSSYASPEGVSQL